MCSVGGVVMGGRLCVAAPAPMSSALTALNSTLEKRSSPVFRLRVTTSFNRFLIESFYQKIFQQIPYKFRCKCY